MPHIFELQAPIDIYGADVSGAFMYGHFVAAAIDDMADAIVTKAAQKAKEAIENAACHDPETKLQSALG